MVFEQDGQPIWNDVICVEFRVTTQLLYVVAYVSYEHSIQLSVTYDGHKLFVSFTAKMAKLNNVRLYLVFVTSEEKEADEPFGVQLGILFDAIYLLITWNTNGLLSSQSKIKEKVQYIFQIIHKNHTAIYKYINKSI